MNMYITSGTLEFLKKKKEKHPMETMILMTNSDHALLIHETTNTSLFHAPRKYEIIGSFNKLPNYGLVVMNNITVTEEGSPLFEYYFKHNANLFEKETGFLASRILRPLTTHTYIILTIWKDSIAYSSWENSKLNEKMYTKIGTFQGVSTNSFSLFSIPTYVTKYVIYTEEIH